MKIKILIVTFFLGLFLGNVNSVAANSCTDVGGACQGGIVCDTGTTPADQKSASVDCEVGALNLGICCKSAASSTTTTETTSGCCVISQGNCKTVSSQADCKDAMSYDPYNSCDKHQDVCKSSTTTGCSGICKASCLSNETAGTLEENASCRTAVPVCCKAGSGATGATVPTEFVNPITADSLEDLLGSLLSTLQGLVAIIAIIMLIVGGMMYMFAGVDEKMVETAKKTIGGAVIGIAIVFAAPAFLKEIQTILCGTGSTTAFCAGALDSTGVTNGALTLKQIAENVLNFLLSIVGILGIIGLIIGGGFYLTAYGDEDRIKKGKDIIWASLTGIIIASAALIIVKQIAAIIDGK